MDVGDLGIDPKVLVAKVERNMPVDQQISGSNNGEVMGPIHSTRTDNILGNGTGITAPAAAKVAKVRA